MSTSGSTIGTSPAAIICRAASNCWVTMSLIPAPSARLMNERILVPKIRLALALTSRAARSGIGFINWAPRLSAARPLSTFKRHHPFHIPQIVRGGRAIDLAVHRILEQDGADDALAGEGRAGHDPCPHLMHDREHLFLGGPRVVLDAVGAQCVRRTATALVQRRNEPGMCPHLFQLFLEIAHIAPRGPQAGFGVSAGFVSRLLDRAEARVRSRND